MTIPIINQIKSKIRNILKKHKVVRAGIFGNYARGEQRIDSDVDILINISAKNFSLLDQATIKIELEETLKKDVNLLTYKSINPHIKEFILKDEVRII